MIRFIAFLIFLIPAISAAEFVKENLERSPNEGFIVYRYYTDGQEAHQQCTAMAATRAVHIAGCFGPAPMGSGISLSWGGWYGECIAESCPIGPDKWIYLNFFGCTRGYKYVGSTDYCIKDRTISIEGPSITTALPAGPVIMQTVKIKDSSEAVSNISINIKLFENSKNIDEINTSSNAQGEYIFKYVPPYFESRKLSIKASCTDCENTASQEITVFPLHFDEPKPQTCRR